MKRSLFLILISVTLLKAQDPLFYLHNQALIFLNPAYTGSNEGFRLQALNRLQWPNLSGSYVTTGLSADAYIKPIKAGIGISFLNNNAAKGTLIFNRYNLSYAQHFKINNDVKIIPAIELSFIEYKLDLSKLNFGDQIDPRRGFVINTPEALISVKKYNFDFSSGFITQYKNICTIGFAAHHINRPDVGLMGPSQLPIRFTVHASYYFMSPAKRFSMQIFTRYLKQQNFALLQITPSVLIYKHILLGFTYLNSKTTGVMLGFKNNWFSLNYCLDNNFNLNSFSHEIGLTYNIVPKEKRNLNFMLENF